MNCDKAYFFTKHLGAVDLAIYWKSQNTMIIADLHLGYEEALHKEGILIPRNHLTLVKKKLEKIFAQIKINEAKKLDTLVINGDLRHQFGPLSSQEWKETLSLLSFMKSKADRIIAIKGNHDPNIEFLESRVTNLKVTEKYKQNDLLVTHGDDLPDPRDLADVKVMVIGHEHPVVSLKSPVTTRREPYKCFLKGSFRGSLLIVQPSFNLLAKGSDLTREIPLSPFLKEADLNQFETFPVSDEGEIYNFRDLGGLFSPKTQKAKDFGGSWAKKWKEN